MPFVLRVRVSSGQLRTVQGSRIFQQAVAQLRRQVKEMRERMAKSEPATISTRGRRRGIQRLGREPVNAFGVTHRHWKAVCFSEIVRRVYPKRSLVVAHRAELIFRQRSMSAGRSRRGN